MTPQVRTTHVLLHYELKNRTRAMLEPLYYHVARSVHTSNLSVNIYVIRHIIWQIKSQCICNLLRYQWYFHLSTGICRWLFFWGPTMESAFAWWRVTAVISGPDQTMPDWWLEATAITGWLLAWGHDQGRGIDHHDGHGLTRPRFSCCYDWASVYFLLAWRGGGGGWVHTDVVAFLLL